MTLLQTLKGATNRLRNRSGGADHKANATPLGDFDPLGEFAYDDDGAFLDLREDHQENYVAIDGLDELLEGEEDPFWD